jgi:F-box/leucine-rich repeat protein 14
MPRVHITARGLGSLNQLASLRILDVRLPNDTDDNTMSHFANMTQLTELDISNCVQVTDTGLMHLRQLTSLRALLLYFSDHITLAGLQALLPYVPSLSRLNVMRFPMMSFWLIFIQ